jgi:hypothetical protein
MRSLMHVVCVCVGAPPASREALWPSRFNQTTNTYKFLQTVIEARKLARGADQQLLVVDAQFLALQRGRSALVLLTNQQHIARLHRVVVPHHWPLGTKLCNVFWPLRDCLTLTSSWLPVNLGELCVCRAFKTWVLMLWLCRLWRAKDLCSSLIDRRSLGNPDFSNKQCVENCKMLLLLLFCFGTTIANWISGSDLYLRRPKRAPACIGAQPGHWDHENNTWFPNE